MRYRRAFSGASDGRLAARGPAAAARTYTIDADFDEGVMVGVNHDVPAHDQLQLNETPSTFPFIWVALSGRDTVAKIDTVNGRVLGEFWSRPEGRPGNPSRTTVDLDGNVWVGNRAEPSPGSIVRIGLLEAGQCVDRNRDGRIDTSTGLRDVLPWPKAGGADDNGGVTTAVDECIIDYVRVPPGGVRTIAVDDHNDVWVGGVSDHIHVKVDSRTGQVVDRFDAACGGYGGLIDGNGVLWSANSLLYLDPVRRTMRCVSSRGPMSYGLGINTEGYVFNSTFSGDSVIRYSPSGLWTAEFPTGGASGDRGVAVTPADNHVWVANSAGSDVSRLDENGRLLAVVRVEDTPTGVAVDQAGKVWVTNMGSSSASRIDPDANRVDLTVDLGTGASPYNYSDMTGMVARSFTTRRGSWLVVHDGGEAAAIWGTVSWTSSEPDGTGVAVRARAAETPAELGAARWQDAANGAGMNPIQGRYLQIEAVLSTEFNGVTPILYDLTVEPGTPRTPPPTPTATATPTATSTPSPTPTPTATPTPAPLFVPLAVKESCPIVSEHADIALVVDASTSMLEPTAAGPTKLQAAVAAIRAFLDLIEMPDDRAAVIAFNDSAWRVVGLSGDRAAVASGLDRIVVALHTRTDLALELATEELAAYRSERPESRPVIILLTDGLPNPVGEAEVMRAANDAKRQGIVVFTIGLGRDVNELLLRSIASLPDHYYAAPDGGDLTALYGRIARRLPCPGVSFWPGY